MATRILVVDDEPQIRRAIRAGLHAHGFEVEQADTGESALDSIALRAPDVVILDLGLPDIQGTQVVREVREWSTVPIIILSVRGDERDKVQALDSGADDYVTKPFGMGELLARIRVALRHTSGQQSPDPVLQFGELRIDLPRRLVTVAGREVHLTPTEFELLTELATNAGKVLTHQMLLSRVWGPESAESTHYLRVYINQLRNKLESEPTRPRFIMTEPGVGYRFREEPLP
ncbi:MAG TPA: response regulator [Nitrolancea sp.]|nr:response regulator [Nitrolancea sp.]